MNDYIGGKARNMHLSKKRRVMMKRGRSIAGKVAVMALLDRHGKDGVSQVRPEVLTSLTKRTVQGHVRNHVESGSNLAANVLKKPSRNYAVVNVSADNPEGTLDRFTDGLRRVLSVGKPLPPPAKRRQRRRRKPK